MSFVQYLKDTRGELNHVAWPTRVQTVVYTILVVLISIFVSLYLGFADFLFTSGLGALVKILPQKAAAPSEIPQQAIDLNTIISTTSDTTTE